ncbi:LOW QUALITY PROTEIN: cell growth-regulating nucleolar protein [Suncus etruscus]|uniref:LOW QUALITY PROTEIN: cell growth-regulating nucleolar protein n=1 Tax=Suncus etruscus TaxID=109475 RepID=UPI00210F978F|nr:LOW QUALITY PROTEIN: cell growth-regulating nucleolar protein [Suncus etruscus]
MVFFTCNACGDSVKKAQVEKHVAACQNCECLSCIDCGKDFWGDDYKNHVKCLSEDQKYGGKGYEGKSHKGDVKQQVWLQKINELMKRSNISPKVKELLEHISGFDNVPRKKAKFQNWMKNSLKVHSESLLDQVWSLFSEAASNDPEQKPPGPVAAHPHSATGAPTKKPPPGADETGGAKPAVAKKNKRERKEEWQKIRTKEKKELRLEDHHANCKGQKLKKRRLDPASVAAEEAGEQDDPKAAGPTRKKKRKGQHAENGVIAGDGAPEASRGKRKRKHSEASAPVEAASKKKKNTVPGPASDEGAADAPEAPAQGKFNWKGTIRAVLKQAPDNEISVKKLRKKVLAQYYTVSSQQHQSEEELLAIFNRKISKNPSLKLFKDKVKLLK